MRNRISFFASSNITAILITVLFCLSLLELRAQTPTGGFSASDSLYFQRLEYVCKVWGYAKYFHAGINENRAWDDVLLRAIQSVKSAKTTAEYNAVLEQILSSAGKVPLPFTAAVELPKERRITVDYSWMRDSTMLSANVMNALETIRRDFRPFPSYFISRSGVGTPQAANENTYSTMTSFDEPYRLLALFRHWNIINYFYPYKDDIGRAWDMALRDMIPVFVGTASNPAAYSLALYKMSAQINDSHGFITNPFFVNTWGTGVLPMEVRYIEGKTVVSALNFTPALLNAAGLSALRVGDVITAINREPLDSARKRLAPFIPASNASALQRDLNYFILYGVIESVQLGVQRGTDTMTIQARRVSFADRNAGRTAAASLPIWRILDNNIGYVDMGRLQRADITRMMNDLSATSGIIFDVRNYPEFILYDLCANLGSSRPFVMFTAPDYMYPGTFAASSNPQISPPFVNVNSIGGTKRYQGKLVALMNEVTQSRAEFTLMGFRAMGTILVGSQTAGADGDVVTVPMPGNVIIYYTSLGVYYPDGKPTQRIGLVPDVEIKPTIAGIQAGRDELLERGMKVITDLVPSLPVVVSDKAVSVFPNPSQNDIRVSFPIMQAERVQIQIFNILGAIVLSTDKTTQSGLNVQSLVTTAFPNGMYICRVTTQSGQVIGTQSFVISR